MIRDPSDGTVREIVVDEKVGKSNLKPKTSHVDNDLMSSTTSGLRQPTRTDAQLRLEESRKWLKTYFAKKEREHADGADTEAGAGLRSGSAGLEQQGDCSEARDQPAHGRGSPG